MMKKRRRELSKYSRKAASEQGRLKRQRVRRKQRRNVLEK